MFVNDEIDELQSNKDFHMNIENVFTYQVVDRDPMSILSKRFSSLQENLVTQRKQLMSQDVFSFYRGSNDLMTSDLLENKSTGVNVVIGGDVHLKNFGFFANATHQLIFDMNDFDESRIRPWEWDVKRLVVSTIIAGQNSKFSEDEINELLDTGLNTYHQTLKFFSKKSGLERFLFQCDIDSINKVLTFNKEESKNFSKLIKKTKKRDSNYVVKKYAEDSDNGSKKFIINNIDTYQLKEDEFNRIRKGFYQAVEENNLKIQVFFSQYSIVDIVFHSVGIGSRGTDCYLMLLQHLDGSFLVLQIKEAMFPYDELNNDKARYDRGKAIVESQKLLQSSSDNFLMHFNSEGKNYYIRQFKDMKKSVNIDKLSFSELQNYVQLCYMILAKSHLQSPNDNTIYLKFDADSKIKKYIKDYGWAYAQQVNQDYLKFRDGVK